MKFYLGSDPEWFLTKDGKKPISVIGKIGGTKQDPLPVPDFGISGFSLQEDNVALEYNTPATDDGSLWVEYHSMIREHIRTKLKHLGLKPLIQGSVVFDDEELADPRAWVFGCDPDVNAWTGYINPRPVSANQNLRAAGGHIHIGAKYAKFTKMQKIFIVRHLDLHLGIPLMVADPDKNRQQLYGKAGAFRFKTYGLEYRTPSNFWTRSRDFTQNVVFACEHALNSFWDGKQVPQDVQVVLDEHDISGAKSLMDKHGTISFT
jgi:hypothetical protein